MKAQVNELAVFGGNPMFPQPLHVGRPNIGNRQRLMERLTDLLDRKWLSNNGYYVQELEKQIADFLGVKHCIAMCNGTLALEIAIRALGLSGEVIVPSFTFIATAHALQWQGITPVFCDVDPITHTLNPCCIADMITPNTTGIIGVHLWGQPCDTEALTEIADKHQLKLMFDAAHAFGCSHEGRRIGNFGDLEVLSFHATKFVNAFEGGAVVTNNDELAAKIRSMQNFGFANNGDGIYVGTNGKMSEASAAMGLTSLESIDEFTATNYRNYKRYQAELAGIPGITLFPFDEFEHNNYQYIVLTVNETETGIHRDQLVKILQAENVIARRYFYPGCHRMEPYRSYFPHAGLLLPETEKLAEQVFALPTGTAIEAADISKICQILRLSVLHSHEVQERFCSEILKQHESVQSLSA